MDHGLNCVSCFILVTKLGSYFFFPPFSPLLLPYMLCVGTNQLLPRGANRLAEARKLCSPPL